MKPICPESIAYKLAAAANFYTPDFAKQLKTRPRMDEVAWFLQWQSTRPGGLEKFAETFIDAFPERLGTPTLLRNGHKPFTPATRHEVAEEIPSGLAEYKYNNGHGDPADVVAFGFWESVHTGQFFERRLNLATFSKLTPACFFTLCRKAAKKDLARALTRFCSLPDSPEKLTHRHWHDDSNSVIPGEDRPLPDVWYFHDLPGALIACLDIHCAREAKAQATTQVTIKTADALNYAFAQNAMVRIEGQTRFGKSHAAKTYCAMYPGRARLVATPSAASEFDLLSAIAEALGFLVTPATPLRELKTKIEFIIKYGRLMLIFDEAHFLFPGSPRRFTSPKRLDWIRTRIVDCNCPLALITTPQEFQNSVNKIVKGAGHNIDQFLGRTMLAVPLPAELDETDLRAVARFHFPDIDTDYLEIIMGKALRTEGFLMAIQGIAKRAAYLAQCASRANVTLADIRQAAEEFMPSVQAPAPIASAPPLRLHRAEPARPVKPNRNTRPVATDLKAPSRTITPESQPA